MAITKDFNNQIKKLKNLQDLSTLNKNDVTSSIADCSRKIYECWVNFSTDFKSKLNKVDSIYNDFNEKYDISEVDVSKLEQLTSKSPTPEVLK